MDVNNHLDIYEKLRKVPQEAKKIIEGGRLKGFTDINPMWRIKTLTETFGVCGFGWYYEITKKEIIFATNENASAFVDINLYVKINNNEWSKPIPGVGGSTFMVKEKNGLYVSDEAYKMALTDAISVAAKALGLAADVYFEKDRTKYTTPNENKNKISKPALLANTDSFIKAKEAIKNGYTIEDVKRKYEVSQEVEKLLLE